MIDLHVHSNYSDGKLSVTELLQKAINDDISVLSITDHDNMESTRDLKEKTIPKKITMIPGIEMSTIVQNIIPEKKIHLLGYGYDSDNIELIKAIENIYKMRAEDNQEYIADIISKYPFLLQEFFKDFDYGKYGWIKKRISQQIAPFLKEREQEEINQFMIEHKPSYRGYHFILEDAIKKILDAGGYPVLAHPYQLNVENEQLDLLVSYLKNCGLAGIESYHNGATKEEAAFYHLLALKYDLLESGGSDYHRSDKKLGCTHPEMKTQEPSLVKKLVRENKIIRRRE